MESDFLKKRRVFLVYLEKLQTCQIFVTILLEICNLVNKTECYFRKTGLEGNLG